MKKILALLSIIALLSSCNSTTKKTEIMKDETKKPSQAIDTTTPKVIGIGGIFFFSDNPKEAQDWYSKNLGIKMNDWGGSSFEGRNIDNPAEKNTLEWSLFKKGDAYFAPSKKEFMINYRVQNIERLVENLKKNGVTILDSIATYDYGKFIHIMDTEGNKIELWEPAKEQE